MSTRPKIGLVSDTHGSLHPGVFEALLGVEMILHAGDVDSPAVLADLEAIAPVAAVRGNMDRSLLLASLPSFRTVEWRGLQIGLIHNRNKLAQELAAAGRRVEELNVVVFGHTHEATAFRQGGVLFVNPGSAKAGQGRASVARLWLDSHGAPAVEHVALG